MDARRLPARHGALWLLAGFALFRRHPPLMTLLTFAYLLTVISINLIPKIGPFLLPLVLPALTVMLANGYRAVERGEDIAGGRLMAGVREERVGLARLGGLHLVGSALLVFAATLTLGEPADLRGGIGPEQAKELLVDMAAILAMASPLLMAFWFAPLLTAWDGVGAVKALFFSFVASWRNWRAFTVYGLVLAFFGAVVPGLLLIGASLVSSSLVEVFSVALRMLLIFVLAPSMMASIYLSYRDVFAAVPATDAPDAADAPPDTTA